jgi:hypothetical protein
MPVPNHYGFPSFPVVNWFCLFVYLWVLTLFPFSCVSLIFKHGQSSHDDDRKKFKVIMSTTTLAFFSSMHFSSNHHSRYGSVFILILFLFGHFFQIHSLLFLSVTCRCPFWTGHTFSNVFKGRDCYYYNSAIPVFMCVTDFQTRSIKSWWRP